MVSSIAFFIKELDDNSYHPLVKGMLDGTAIILILDTGASRTVIDKELVINYPTITKKNQEPFAAGINAEKIAIEQKQIPIIQLGGIEFTNMIVFSTELEAVSKLYEEMAGIKISGLLGCDFLEEHKAVVDFKRREIIF